MKDLKLKQWMLDIAGDKEVIQAPELKQGECDGCAFKPHRSVNNNCSHLEIVCEGKIFKLKPKTAKAPRLPRYAVGDELYTINATLIRKMKVTAITISDEIVYSLKADGGEGEIAEQYVYKTEQEAVLHFIEVNKVKIDFKVGE